MIKRIATAAALAAFTLGATTMPAQAGETAAAVPCRVPSLPSSASTITTTARHMLETYYGFEYTCTTIAGVDYYTRHITDVRQLRVTLIGCKDFTRHRRADLTWSKWRYIGRSGPRQQPSECSLPSFP